MSFSGPQFLEVAKLTAAPPTVVRDVRDRGRDVEGCIKQWFSYVKPNFEKVASSSTPAVGITDGPLCSSSCLRRTSPVRIPKHPFMKPEGKGSPCGLAD